MYQHLINFFQPPLEEVIIFPKNAIKLENTIKLMVILSDTTSDSCTYSRIESNLDILSKETGTYDVCNWLQH